MSFFLNLSEREAICGRSNEGMVVRWLGIMWHRKLLVTCSLHFPETGLPWTQWRSCHSSPAIMTCVGVSVYKGLGGRLDSRASVLQRIVEVLTGDCVHTLQGFWRPVLHKEKGVISRRVFGPLGSGNLKSPAVDPSRLCFLGLGSPPPLGGPVSISWPDSLSCSQTLVSSPPPGTEQGLSQNLFNSDFAPVVFSV